MLALVVLAAFAPPLSADRLTEYDTLRARGEVEAGLALLRTELADNRRAQAKQPDRNVYLRQRLLYALGDYGALRGVTPELDAEARRFFEEGMAIAGDRKNLAAYMQDGMQIYYSTTLRNGLALQYARSLATHWEAAGDPLRTFLARDALVKAYWDMGEFELGTYYIGRALDAADLTFLLGRRPAELQTWMTYSASLLAYMDFAAQRHDLELLDALWQRLAPIGSTYAKLGAEARFAAAETYLLAGDVARAEALLAEGRDMWAREQPFWTAEQSVGPVVVRKMEVTIRCAEGGFALVAKRYDDAAARLDDCIRLVKEDERPVGLDTLYRLRGRALEGVGRTAEASNDYRASIAQSEITRSTFTIAERARYFRGQLRGAYWGLTRIRATDASRGDDAAFFDALNTSEQVRGRQLGELIDANMSQRISTETLRTLQLELAPDTIVLAYTATDDELIVLAFTREEHLAAVVPHRGGAFAALARSIARDLATPSSAISRLEERLLAMSEPILAAARPLLAGKKRIVALPDGAMNLVPFDLLSSNPTSYRALIDDYVVSASPSLVFIQHARSLAQASQPRLFAVADPIYAEPTELGGSSAADVRAARGSEYLRYFQRLPETATEAEAIAQTFATGASVVLTGNSALESLVKSRDLSQFAYLHFATHGILGGEVPGVDEPALVLGPEENENGFLTASEVSNLRLGAELAVLSACKTGSGEYVSGEGVMGLSRAFLGSGSRAVVVSLWSVASKETEELMIDLYARLQRDGDAALALRDAKLAMIDRAKRSDARKAHPFFWAPFIVLGG